MQIIDDQNAIRITGNVSLPNGMTQEEADRLIREADNKDQEN